MAPAQKQENPRAGVWLHVLFGLCLLVCTTEHVRAALIVHVPAGYSTIADNYFLGGNMLSEVFPFAEDGTQIIKWDPITAGYEAYAVYAGSWCPDRTLAPGEGAFLFTP